MNENIKEKVISGHKNGITYLAYAPEIAAAMLQLWWMQESSYLTELSRNKVIKVKLQQI